MGHFRCLVDLFYLAEKENVSLVDEFDDGKRQIMNNESQSPVMTTVVIQKRSH